MRLRFFSQKIVVTLLSLGLTGCATLPRGTSSVRILAQSNRLLEIEPCGCSLGPLGGVEREWNYLEQVRANTPESVYVLAGSTFSKSLENNKLLTSELRVKAGYLAEALAKMKVEAIGLTAQDFLIGKSSLLELKKNYQLPIVSSDLVDEKGAPLFSNFLEVQKGETTLVFVSLTDPHLPEALQNKDFSLLSPERALERVRANRNPKENELVVLLTNLKRDSLEPVLEKFPEIKVVLGGPISYEDLEKSQISKGQVLFNPPSAGKYILDLKLSLQPLHEAFFNSNLAQSAKTSLRFLYAEKKKAEERAPATNRHLDSWIQNYEKIPQAAGAQTSLLEFESVALDSTYETKKNSMSHLVKRYVTRANKPH